MSADSLNTRTETRSIGSCIVTPQQVIDPTILDSVAGFINEVVPTSYTGLPQESKDQIQWAHFEQLDCDESTFSPDYDVDKIVPPPLILVLGYGSGIQVWAIPANGEATEILSWRHGSVRVMRVLPNPYFVGATNTQDVFANKRPLVALCDSATPSSQFCSLSFLSLKTSEQVKVIKFKNPIIDVVANRRSVVVTFNERIAVFDAFTLEDRLTVTTCYLSPGLNANPVALGTKWLAYAEKRLNQSKRSSAGNEGEGLQSYTATVLHAAKSIGRGLREFGESMASSLTGTQTYKPGTSPNSPQAGGMADIPHKGVVTILDIENPNVSIEKSTFPDAVVAHFTAHTEAIVSLQFDPSGMLLLTADKRGHDFHLFRINSHPGGPALAAVHHLYVLHRGDTTARVQDVCFSPDSRWVAVSTMRGTTHVFPITPYGGNVGVRTHGSPHVVNKMSRFHRSAGLTAEGRSNSPVSQLEMPVISHLPYNNPRFPPYPHPTVINPLAQIRQPVLIQNVGTTTHRTPSGRQRLPSSSEETIALKLATCFAPSRAWIDGVPACRETTTNKMPVKAVESLFVMSCHGSLVQYDLDPRHSQSIPKERVCDDSPIDLGVVAKAQWTLQRPPNHVDIPLPLSLENLNFVAKEVPLYKKSKPDHNDDHWLSQVEIVTHAGPHRRLWMGPQFTFKTYTTSTGSPMSLNEAQPLDLGRSKPVNMPITKSNAVLIESSSASSCEQTLLENYHKTFDESGGGVGESRLKEELADAMMESPSTAARQTGGRCVIVSVKPHVPTVAKVVNPLGTVVTVQSEDDDDVEAVEAVDDDVIILENCDEALFRPMVTAKPLRYMDAKSSAVNADRIVTKNLENNTEVAVKILQKGHNVVPVKKTSPPPPVSVKKASPTPPPVSVKQASPSPPPVSIKKASPSPPPVSVKKASPPPPSKETMTANKNVKETKPAKVEEKVAKSNSKPAVEAPVSKSVKESKTAEKSPTPTRKFEKLDVDFDLDLPPPVDLDFDLGAIEKDFLTLGEPKIESFVEVHAEETVYLKNNKEIDSRKFKDKYQGLDMVDVVSDDMIEEKSFSKKPRRPKPKLGVKIANVNKENACNLEKTIEDCTAEITLPAPKRTWSSIASSKPQENDKLLLESTEKEKDTVLDSVVIENFEHFTIQLPEKTYSVPVVDDLVNIDAPNEDNEEPNPAMEESVSSDDNLLKADKSSDDEKLDLGSSTAETTTESDDSVKTPPEVDSNVDEECNILKTNVPMSKASKRKLRKKRK